VTRARSAAILGAAVAGAALTVALRGGPRAPAAPPPPPLTTARIVRSTLRTTVLTGGTLSYAAARPVVNRLAGTYTALPRSGGRVDPGGRLYSVDDRPVVLMAGGTPAWRAFAPKMADGGDVAELQANLIALGYAAGLLSAPDGHYGVATADAVKRWQVAQDEPATGRVAMGEIVFLPRPVRVGGANVAIGDVAVPGQAPFQATQTRRVVSVPVTPILPETHLGERVAIVLPSGTRTPGTVTGVGSTLTVAPARPAATGTSGHVAVQVSLTTSTARRALVAPVAALLALAGGGYGVEIVEPGGTHRLVGVHTGLFAGGRVQLRGAGLRAGTRVVVAQ
jgi:peptidoglycan hydrolase-like protein with peptidoglycan-binding domain